MKDARRRARAQAVAGGRPLVSADLATVTWLTGLATDIEIGPSPFTASPLVILDPDGSVLLVVSEDEAPGAATGVDTRTFPGFAVDDVDRPALARSAALEAVSGAQELAVDLRSLPGDLAAALVERDVRMVDVGRELSASRAVKDDDEIEALRAATDLADAGQAAARSAVDAGTTELDVWASCRSAMEAAAGGRVPLLADIASGPRTAEVGGPPGPRRIAAGECVLVDLVPRLGGYWADSCATIAAGEAAPEIRRAHEACVAALEAAMELCTPGTRAGRVDAAARETVQKSGGSYPHHTGHGIGVSFHEEPRVIPGSQRVLEEGMVIALEPGSYGDGFGVRVEHVALVTSSGPEILSGHDLSL
jgi:Xaa-Pro dipeptidase